MNKEFEEYLYDETYYTDDKRDEMRLRELDLIFDNPMSKVEELVIEAKNIQEKYNGK